MSHFLYHVQCDTEAQDVVSLKPGGLLTIICTLIPKTCIHGVHMHAHMQLEMQINIADESVMTPDTSFAQESVETNLLLAKSTPAASNPHTLTTS